MENIFFNGWPSILRTVILTILAYITMIFFLRVSGQRTLAKMNAFDFIITIALGSAFATVALNKNVTLADGSVAFFLFISLQATLTWLSVRSKSVKNIITSSPTMLLYKGDILWDVLKRERITLDEIHMAARKKGIVDLHQIDLIVLETTGDITIIEDLNKPHIDTLNDIENYNHQAPIH